MMPSSGPGPVLVHCSVGPGPGRVHAAFRLGQTARLERPRSCSNLKADTSHLTLCQWQFPSQLEVGPGVTPLYHTSWHREPGLGLGFHLQVPFFGCHSVAVRIRLQFELELAIRFFFEFVLCKALVLSPDSRLGRSRGPGRGIRGVPRTGRPLRKSPGGARPAHAPRGRAVLTRRWPSAMQTGARILVRQVRDSI